MRVWCDRLFLSASLYLSRVPPSLPKMQGNCSAPSLKSNASRSMAHAPSAFPQHRFLPSLLHDHCHLHNHPCRRSARLAFPAAPLTPILASPLSTPTPSIHDHHGMASCIVPNTPSTSIPPPTWTATPPTPPAVSLSHRPRSVHVPPCIKNHSDPSVVVKRRASLPPTPVSKPLPPIPDSTHSGPNASLPTVSSRRQDTSKPRPLFHIGTDDPEMEGHDQPSDVPCSSSVSKENSRRCHALSELLSTELGYLIDLRILVCVYLRLLPVLVSRSASSSTHASSSNLSAAPISRTPSLLGMSYLGGNPRAPSNQHINGTKPFSFTHSTDCYAHNLLIFQPLPPAKDKDKCSPRHLFSSSDLDIITRNADQILEFHENLVRRLRAAVAQFGFPMKWSVEDTLERPAHPADLQRAIDAVSTVFIEHASSFDRYRSFCSGHPDALNVLHKVQQKYPSEWEAFEQRCADIATEILTETSPHSPQGTKPDDHQGSPVALDTGSMSSRKKRRHSLSSLDVSTRAQVLPHVLSSFNLKPPNISASENGHNDSATGVRRPRLLFVDYLIKPVQRICKYPLLLDQLQFTIPAQEPDFGPCHEVIERAAHVMRTVTSSVDEASRQQDLAVKTGLIVSRICQGIAASTTNSGSQYLTTGFLLSLGSCQIVGSLDVIYYYGSSLGNQGTVKAKYLGAFLFTGGFFVLAKVAKLKAYEPRHWFSLKGFELTDSSTDGGLLPSWFRLSFKGHTFELAASCRREKDIWMDVIRSALSEEPTWNGDPPTSFHGDGRTDIVVEDVPFEIVAPLPTIHSIPELESDADFSATGEVACNPADMLNSCRTNHRVDYAKVDMVSRRASAVSCKFYPTSSVESGTFHLVRSTTPAREQVERDLLDVFSETLLAARYQASALEEDLFEGRTVARSFSRSSSGLTMASAVSVAAKNKLTRRESVLVPRRASFIDAGNNSSLDVETCGPVLRPNRPVRKRRQPKKLKVIMAKPVGSEDVFVESPSPVSHCSSTSVTALATPLDSPGPITTNLPGLESGIARQDSFRLHQQGCTPKRSRSMIENVRGLFVSRSASPVSVLVREPSVGSGTSGKGLLKWWSRETFRHRSRSAPDTPRDELPTSKSLGPEVRRPSILLTDRPYSSQSDLKRLSLPSHRHGPSTQRQGHVRHSSVDFELGYEGPARGKLFSTRSRRASMSLTASLRDREGECAGSAGVSKLRRSLSFFQRLTPMGSAAS